MLTFRPVRWLEKGSAPREAVKRGVMETARLLGTLTHVSTREPAVALTFDDGPDPDYTPRLLDLLARYGAKATFFVVGLAARENRQVLRRAAEEGHALGNHSWDHPSFPLLTGRAQRLQMRWCDEVLPAQEMKLFRPPWGHQSLKSRLNAALLGYRVVAWSAMAEDWRDDPAEDLVARVEERLRPGAIVLFHDALFRTDAPGHRDRTPTLEAVEMLLERYGERYRFVTVPELLRLGSPRKWHWYKRSDLDWLHRQIGGRTW